MKLTKNNGKNLIFFLLKTLLFIIGLNIVVTSCFHIIKLELKNNNLEYELNLDINKLNYDKNF